MNQKHRLQRLLGLVLVAMMAFPTNTLTENEPSSLTRQFDQYWAKRRQVRNIHKRLFLKDGRHEFSIVGGIIPNDDFFLYYPIGARYDWYVTEDLAVEVDGSYIIETKSDLEKFLEKQIYGSVNVDLPQKLMWQAGAGVMWTPFHGKIGAFSTYLGHFDFGIKLGVMAIGTEVSKDDNSAGKPRVDVGGNAGVTVRLYFLDFMALRIDYRHYFYAARDTEDDVRGLSYLLEISMGLSFFTSAPK